MKDINSIKKDIFELVNNYSDIKFSKKEFLPGISEIPAAGKYIDNSEMINMVDACLDGWLTIGLKWNNRYERFKELRSKNYNEFLICVGRLAENLSPYKLS